MIIKMQIQTLNPKKNVHAYLIIPESNSRCVTLYSDGYDGTVGIIFNATNSINDTAPCCLLQAALRIDLEGCNLPEYLQKILSEREYSFAILITAKETVRDIGAKVSCVVLVHEYELQQVQASPELKQNCELSNGQVNTNSSERFGCPEVLFKSDFVGLEKNDINKLTFLSIMKCDVDNRKDLFNSNVCSGCTTMLQGIIT